MRIITIVLLFISCSDVRAGECNQFSDYAKFECAKAGDDLAAIGDFEGAMVAWRISCNKGLSSSCSTVVEMARDMASFKRKYEADPSNKIDAEVAKKNAKITKCKMNSGDNTNCLTEARQLVKAGDTSAARNMLDGMCDNNDAQACFELGGLYVRSKDYDQAVDPYMSACSLGNNNACTVLQQVQAKLKMKSDENAREDEKQRRIAAEDKAERQERAKAWQDASDKFINSFKKNYEPPKKNKRTCTTRSNHLGGFETECEDNPW